MKLVYPIDEKMKKWGDKELPALPTKLGIPTDYRLISVAKEGHDLYVCLTDSAKSQIWIEKMSTFLKPNNYIQLDDLELIKDDKEFMMAYNFFVKENILTIKKD